jgi:hypothetical protein
MSERFVRTPWTPKAKQCASALLLLSGLATIAPSSWAQVNLGPVTIGAGLRTSFTHTDPEIGLSTDRFALDSARIYINGPVTGKIKFMFNTEYNGADNKIGVLDAVARFEYSSHFNLWAGRFLPPSDRANLYGPYYANQWGVYTDGIQNGHPFVFQGRDNGVMYWGDFAKKRVKISVGAFDGPTTSGRREVLSAARVQFHLRDIEEGYYLNGTYYGGKNLFTIGAATQVQAGDTATTVDLLIEQKLGSAGVVTVESEYANYNRLGGYDGNYSHSQGAYALASYLFPKAAGPGKFQVLGKFAKADFTQGRFASYNQKTTELNLNYIIKEFNARLMSFYRHTNFNRNRPDTWQLGLGFQIQM